MVWEGRFIQPFFRLDSGIPVVLTSVVPAQRELCLGNVYVNKICFYYVSLPMNLVGNSSYVCVLWREIGPPKYSSAHLERSNIVHELAPLLIQSLE